MRTLSTRSFAALLAVACAATLGAAAVFGAAGPPSVVPVAHQGIPVDDPAFADLRAMILALGGSEADAQQVADLAAVPGNAEFFNPFTGAAVDDPPAVIDPLLTVTAELDITDIASLSAPGGPLAAGEGLLGWVAYGQGSTTPTSSEMYMYAKRFPEPCGPRDSAYEYGIVAYDASPLDGGDSSRWQPPATIDLFYGTNTAYVLQANIANEPFSALRFQLALPGAAQRWPTTDSNWIAICTGSTVVGLIPDDEWTGITDLRFFATEVPIVNGQDDFDHAVDMRWPAITDDPILVTSDIPEILLGDEEVPTPTATPAATPSATPAATPAATSAQATPSPAPTLPPPPQLPTRPLPDFALIYLFGAGGIIFIAMALAILLIVRQREKLGVARDCLPLLEAWRRAQALCDAARAAADAAWQKYIEASKAARAAEAAERAARTALTKAEADLAAAEARANADPKSWVEGEPYGKITSDDLALQNEANAEVRAEADAAKAAAMDAWHAAGSPQGDGWAQVDDQLAAIEKVAQAKMAHNNDPANLPELRKKAAERAKAQIEGLKAAVDAARKTLEDATAAKLNAQENESVVGAAAKLKAEEADKACAAADAARRAYEDCVGQAQAAAKAKQAQQPKPKPPVPPTPPGGGGGGVKVGSGGGWVGGDGRDDPPKRPCQNGDEEWRPFGPSRSFTIRADGAKTRVMLWTDPAIKGLEQWIEESGSADKREPGEAHPSISVAEVDFITPERLTEWLRGLGGSKGLAVPDMELHFEIKVKSRTVQCERRWVCDGNAWRPAEARAKVVDRPLPARTLNEGPVTPSIQKVQGFLTRVKALINELKKDEDEADRAGRCQ